MSKAGVLLKYQGHIDLSVIELLLAKIKKTPGFLSLPRITSKRTYCVLVESLENIYKHSASLSSHSEMNKPYILVSRNDDKIVIVTRNPVSNKSRDTLSGVLDELNRLDSEKLKIKHKDILSMDLKDLKKGAGLGLVNMKMRSEENMFRYSFSKISNDYLIFELVTTINI